MMYMLRKQCQHTQSTGGYLLILVLVFGAVFFMIISSFVTFIVTQGKLVSEKVQLATAGQIAEAGLNYYKWYLAHYPNDVTNGTGVPGPYIGVYNDPEGGAIGEYSLTVASTTYCGDVASIDVAATGYTYAQPGIKRVISARYARPTVAEFAFILNTDVWAGPDRIINGPYHSNGGIRMDGTNNSVVTSNVATWSCNSSFGCSPTANRNGVFTTTGNANAALFDFPSAPINFAGLTVDLSSMKTRAQTKGGLYIPPSGAGAYGYRLVFNAIGTVSVYRITATTQYWGYTTEAGWLQERNVFTTNTLVNTYAISDSCPLIYVEDKVWLEGTVKKRVALAAADLTSAVINPSIIIKDNILYTSATTSALLAIAEKDVLLGVDVPNDITVNGIYIAQTGRYGRNHYEDGGGYVLPAGLLPYVIRNSETMNGTIVSNGRVGTQWTSGGVITSGFRDRYNTYDRNLIANPPPLVPNTSDVYEFSDWRDKN
jgi:hypothetical protein